MGLGLNLAAGALLVAVWVSGTEPGGLGAQWRSWWVPASAAVLLGLLPFRFPRSVGLPTLVVLGAFLWFVADALKDFEPLPAELPVRQVQPLTDGETVTAFSLRADFLELPRELPLVPHLWYRFRPGDSDPVESWWPWAISRGWARSVGASLPADSQKFRVYRLVLEGDNLGWTLVPLSDLH